MQNFRDLSRPEKWWVITHPFSAKKALEISQHTRKVSASIKHLPALDDDDKGGRVDAFRHAYWMALLTKELNAKKAWRLGYDHEKGNKLEYKKGKGSTDGVLPTAADCTMDMFNNDAGISIGLEFSHLNRDELQILVLEKLRNGEFIIIKKDEMGRLLDCEGNLIKRDEYMHHWEIPACLVSSDYTTEE